MMLLTVCPKNGKKFLSGPWTKACSRALESEELFLAPSLQFVLREVGGGGGGGLLTARDFVWELLDRPVIYKTLYGNTLES